MVELTYAVAGFAGAIGFVEIFVRAGTPRRLHELLRLSRQASAVLRSSRISDHWKERAIPAYSLAILRATAMAAVQLVAALAAFALIAAALAPMRVSLDSTLFLNWPLNVAALIGGSLYAYWRPNHAAASGNYGAGARLLHRFALGSAAIREVSFDLDQSAGQATRPLDSSVGAGGGNHVFVCGLARAGTSILFRTLYASGAFEALTYRDMPFVLAPRLWRRLTRRHGAVAVEQERAHQDGLSVSFDSPEAFDEVFWLTFARDDYLRPDRLLHHSADDETIARFRKYIAAILASGGGKTRYLSKNNNNVLRLAALRAAFPDAAIVVPFRRPADHAQSLWRQHQGFRKQQTDDPFVRQYMGWLGHYEFGLDHRPFAFGAAMPTANPSEPEYWLEYWIAVYQAILAEPEPATILFDYDAFCETPSETLSGLAQRLDVPVAMRQLAAGIRPARTYDATIFADDVLKRAEAVHAALRRRASESAR